VSSGDCAWPLVRGTQWLSLRWTSVRSPENSREQWPTVTKLDDVRKRVLIHMAFNMGVRGLLTMRRFMSAVECRHWETAAEEMVISQWAKQEPRRASVLAVMMRTGGDEVLRVIPP
jgi:hypothetical protein